MARSSDYIPYADNALLDFGQTLISVSADPLNHTRWGIIKPKDELNALHSEFL